jgi:hypothetical protein
MRMREYTAHHQQHKRLIQCCGSECIGTYFKASNSRVDLLRQHCCSLGQCIVQHPPALHEGLDKQMMPCFLTACRTLM